MLAGHFHQPFDAYSLVTIHGSLENKSPTYSSGQKIFSVNDSIKQVKTRAVFTAYPRSLLTRTVCCDSRWTGFLPFNIQKVSCLADVQLGSKDFPAHKYRYAVVQPIQWPYQNMWGCVEAYQFDRAQTTECFWILNWQKLLLQTEARI